ncbi:amidohydrolase [Kineosporia succinea]|uniref:Amidohydrolase YtcJ n=1 Tax=Kineosporia succinea TaxID=84632 RepID=A0ABT9PBZ5_9ACTN|nr:amidohydrolase [Kineosporia succinea]MDP9830229.1 putative amidohydrolase YtcJ [Kineosporia succinea]
MNRDLLVTGIRVPGRPGVTALAARDGVIVALGSGKDARREVAASARHLDGRGGTLTPGLIDSHAHPHHAAGLAHAVDLGAVRSWDGFLARLRELAHGRAPDSWLHVWNLDYAIFAGRPIRGTDLAEAVHGLPFYGLFFDGHTAVASPRALQRAGVTGRERFRDNSVVVVDENDLPTGELRERSAFQLVAAHLPAVTPEQARAAVLGTLRQMNAVGITGVVSMDGTRSSLDVFDDIDANEGLPVRLQSALTHRPHFVPEEVAEILAQRDRGGRRWRTGLIKLFHDGVIDTGTGWLYEPDTLGDGLASFWPDPSRYRDVVSTYTRAGFQIATHAIGDRAVGETIDAYLAAGVRSASGAPHRIEHLETLTDTDLRRAADAGIAVSMQPLHMQWRHEDHSDSWAHRLGRVRSARGWRAADVLRAGAQLVLGSDWPVAQFDPRIGMAWAVLRREPGNPGAPVFEEHLRLTGEQAVHGYTRAAAQAMGSDRTGLLEIGALADLTVFADDPATVDGDTLATLPVLGTVVDGEVVHEA